MLFNGFSSLRMILYGRDRYFIVRILENSEEK